MCLLLPHKCKVSTSLNSSIHIVFYTDKCLPVVVAVFVQLEANKVVWSTFFPQSFKAEIYPLTHPSSFRALHPIAVLKQTNCWIFVLWLI